VPPPLRRRCRRAPNLRLALRLTRRRRRRRRRAPRPRRQVRRCRRRGRRALRRLPLLPLEGGLLQRSRGTAPPLLLLPPLLVPLPRQLGRFVVCGEHALLSARLAPRQ